MNRFEELLGPLSASTERRVSVLVAAYLDTDQTITLDELVGGVADTISASRSQARLNALALVQEAVETLRGTTYLLGSTAAQNGLESAQAAAKLTAVIHDVVTDGQDNAESLDMRLTRLARGEITHAAQDTTHEALAAEPAVDGWVRDLDAGACQLCQWWSRDGRVWDTGHQMPTHKGCSCRQLPVVGSTVR